MHFQMMSMPLLPFMYTSAEEASGAEVQT